MKKLIIAALVSGIILFVYQFLSYGLLDLHYSQMEYTPAQEEILKSMTDNNLKDGEYYMIRAPKGDAAEQERLMGERIGQPWAMVQYHESLEHPFVMNLIRALLINILACFLLCWILSQFKTVHMRNAIITSVSIGLIAYCTCPYLDSIWFQSNSIPDILDGIVPWAVIGIWLGWFLKRD